MAEASGELAEFARGDVKDFRRILDMAGQDFSISVAISESPPEDLPGISESPTAGAPDSEIRRDWWGQDSEILTQI